MNKYQIRLKTDIKFIKDIEVTAEDKEKAYRLAQSKACDMLKECIKKIEKEDESIKHNMSYYDTTQPKLIETDQENLESQV